VLAPLLLSVLFLARFISRSPPFLTCVLSLSLFCIFVLSPLWRLTAAAPVCNVNQTVETQMQFDQLAKIPVALHHSDTVLSQLVPQLSAAGAMSKRLPIQMVDSFMIYD
jgi:hypothetical protein